MFKTFLQNTIKNSNYLRISRGFFCDKVPKVTKSPNDIPEAKEDYFENGKKIPHIKVFKGTYPYLPLNDHPLIPGFHRRIPISKQLSAHLKWTKNQPAKMVISVLKNPESIEGMQIPK